MQEIGGREVAYRLDARDRIEHVSCAWLAFARENHADGLTRERVLGRPLWDFIRGIETQSVYRALFRAIRTNGSVATLPFRCDSPSTRRFMELRVEPRGEGALQIFGRLVRSEPRLYLSILDTQLPRRQPRVELCSFCKRVHVCGRGWLEADEAVGVVDVFGSDEPPAVDHGLCDQCAGDCADRLTRVERAP